MVRSSDRLASAMGALVLLIALGALAGCDGCAEDAGLERLAPRLELEPAALAFGEVPVGATKRLRLVLRNAGTAALDRVSAEAMAPFRAEPAAAAVRTGAETTIDVAFTPATDEAVTGVLLIASSDPARPMVSVPLSGRGVAGAVTVRPALVDLTATPVGASRGAELFFSNLGVAAAEGRLVFERFARPEHFELTGFARFAEPLPFAVPPRSEAQLLLEYRPFAEGRDDGRIVFEVCGERCGVEVGIEASAAQAAVRLDPPVVDFGTVGIGMTVSKAVVVENAGARPVIVRSVAALGSAELSAASARALPATIPANSSMAVTLEYRPSSAAALEGALMVQTDDPLVPEARVAVTGRGEGPLFLVQPEALSFGAVVEPATHRRSALLLNAGSADVRVESLSVSGRGFALAALPRLPVRLGSGESLLVQVNFTPAELGEYSGELSMTTDDPSRGSATVPLSGARAERLCALEASSERVNFGLLPVGYARAERVSLVNVGGDPCQLVSGAFRAPVDAAISLDAGSSPIFPVVLAPGEQLALSFAYAPTEPRESKANYVLTTGDAVYPERHLSLLGSAEEYGDLYARPEVVDFGTLEPGCAAGRREVALYAAGTASALVESIRLIDAPAQELRLSAPAVPLTLAPGGYASFELSYAPTDVGPDRAAVEISVRDRPYPLIVPVEGSGALEPRAVDQFAQVDHQEVDVMFVIDDSCSMADDQLELARNFRNFIRQATLRNVDFHLGVTTTTVFPSPGAFVGPVLTAATPRLETAFQQQVAVGIMGSGIEQGLDALGGALQLFAANVPSNRGFRRPNATLVVIVVSDEDDQSRAPPLFYANLLRTSAGPGGYLTAVVSGQDRGCGARGVNGQGAAPAPRYEELLALTRGISESICSDWSGTLAHLGDAAFGLRSSFVLSQDADVSHPIVVEVNGVARPPTEWRYEPSDHSIHFTVPPPERAAIRVEYSPTC